MAFWGADSPWLISAPNAGSKVGPRTLTKKEPSSRLNSWLFSKEAATVQSPGRRFRAHLRPLPVRRACPVRRECGPWPGQRASRDALHRYCCWAPSCLRYQERRVLSMAVLPQFWRAQCLASFVMHGNILPSLTDVYQHRPLIFPQPIPP